MKEVVRILEKACQERVDVVVQGVVVLSNLARLESGM